MDNNIRNFKDYNNSMTKSMIDKMFFMDKIDEDIITIFDYGCADGALINFLSQLLPEMNFIGYDNNKDMINAARNKNKDNKNTMFFDSLKEFITFGKERGIDSNNMAINLSSIIHEVYSYSSNEGVKDFWDFVNLYNFKYIIIRDMCLDETAHRPSLKEDLIKIKSKYNSNKIKEFECYNGTINDNYNLVHFLLKYRYVDNWDREVRENYLPCSVEKIASNINNRYELIYFDHYILPFISRVVKRDFDIIIKDYTHVKFIYRLKE